MRSKGTTNSAAKSGTSTTRYEPSKFFNDANGAKIDWCKITSATFTVELCDGRTLLAPTVHLGPVWELPAMQRRKFRLSDDATAVEWPALGYKVTLRQLMGIE